MKKVLSTLVTPLRITNLFRRSEKAASKSIAFSFEKNYNGNNFESIFNMFDANMQRILPLDKTNHFFEELKSEAGDITNRKFVKYKNGFSSYKTTFEKSVFLVNISVNKNLQINGLLIEPCRDEHRPSITRNVTRMRLPFDEEWTVIWGGDTKKLNYHVGHKAQKNAIDLVITDESGKSFRTTGHNNEDYYAFGKQLFAPCDGEVEMVVEGIKDNRPGDLKPEYAPGNSVIIKTSNDEYIFLAHFRQHSIQVKQGQKVLVGDLLGLCGNSGNSTEPHLHFHMQNAENMMVATGIKCYFETSKVNGQTKTDYSPIQNDKIAPEILK